MNVAARSSTEVKTAIPGPKGKALLEKWHRYEADVAGYQAPVVWDTASGCVVTDVDGNRFLDWTSGVLVTNVGHCHPHLVFEVQKAVARLLNNYECPSHDRILAAERLVGALPSHLDKVFFLSTGSEAVEAAIRLMKRHAGKYEILCFEAGFHGRTAAASSVGGLAGPKKGYGPTLPGAIRLPYPNPYRDPYGWCDDGPSFSRYFEHIEGIIRANSTGSIAGIIVEPYQGAGGFIFPPAGWLKRLEEWSRRNGLLFALDEVQSSFGRTGTMWALEHEKLTPDIVTIGKALGCGIPASAVAARGEVFACLSKGEMSSTLGGNPVASAAVCAVLDIFERENLVQNSAQLGAYMKQRLERMKEDFSFVGDVRGSGLVMGLEFVRGKNTKEPAPEILRDVIDRCAENGLLVGGVGVFGNVLRIAPPLVMTREEADESLAILAGVLSSLQVKR